MVITIVRAWCVVAVVHVGGECKCMYITIPSSGEGLGQSLVFPTVSCTCPLVFGS